MGMSRIFSVISGYGPHYYHLFGLIFDKMYFVIDNQFEKREIFHSIHILEFGKRWSGDLRQLSVAGYLQLFTGIQCLDRGIISNDLQMGTIIFIHNIFPDLA